MIDIEQCAVEKGLTHTDYVALCPIRIQMRKFVVYFSIDYLRFIGLIL